MVAKMQKTVLLTFDTEEFDLVRDKPIFNVTYNGIEKVLTLLDKHKIKSTFFITGIFAKSNKNLVKKISKKHEIASHGYSHKRDYKLLNSKSIYEDLNKTNNIINKITNKKVIGYRSPRFRGTDLNILKKLGFKYDSSINPILIPGRYNYLFHKRKIKSEKGIVIIPISASPLFWFAFKNLSLNYSKFITKLCLLDQDFVHLVFHPWEFVDIKDYKIPFIYKLNNGDILLRKLDLYITWCKNSNMEFSTIRDYLISRNYIK